MDTVLSNPKYNFKFDSNYSEVVLKPNPFMTIAEVEKNAGPIWDCLSNPKEYYEENWVPVGNIMGFNNCSIEIFQRTISLIQALAVQQIMTNNKIWKHTDKLAWAINLADLNEQVVLKEDYFLTNPILSFDRNSAFVDYEQGIPPSFSKSLFQYLPPDYISFGNPYQILSENGSTPNAYFVSELAMRILDSHKN